MRRILLLLILLCLSLVQAAPNRLVLVGATLHPVSGAAVSNRALYVENGRLVASLPSDTPVVRLDGLHIYPTMMDADSRLGLREIDAVRPTLDENEVGLLNAHARVDTAFNPDSLLLPVAMSGGVLVAGVQPGGQLLCGRAAVMKLRGWNREDMTLRAPAAMVVQWPSMAIDRHADAAVSVEKQKARIEKRIAVLRDAFEDARAYGTATSIPELERDVQWEALADVLKRRIPLIVRANRLDEIRAAVDFAREQKVDLVIQGGADAWRMAPYLKQHNVGVIYSEVFRVPRRDYEAEDTYYRAPALLWKAGVPVALTVGATASHVRTLPDNAAMAAAYGLPADVAVRSITLEPARMLGVGDRIGSLDAGKDATFIVTDGDLLDGRTRIVRAFLDGVELDLNDRQKQLYERYRNRPRR